MGKLHTESEWLRRVAKPMMLVTLLVLGIVLRIGSLGSVVQRTPDEQSYSWEATILADHDFTRGTEELVKIFADNPGLPAPSRLGYLEATSETMRITGLRDARAGSALSCIASCLALALVAWIGLRFFDIRVALMATLLYAVSPIALTLGRRAWEDAIVEFLALASLALAGELVISPHNSPRRFYGLCTGFAVLGAACLISKEMALLAFLLSALLAVSAAVLKKDQQRGALIACCALLGPSLAICWMAHVFGGFSSLAQMPIEAQRFLAHSAYSLAYESGTPLSAVHALWFISPPTILLLISAALLPPRLTFGRSWPAALGLALFSGALLLLFIVIPHRLNFRYVCGVFGPMALLAGTGFRGLQALILEKTPEEIQSQLVVLTIVLAVVGAGIDLLRFRTHFEIPDLQDLSIRMILSEPPTAPSVAIQAKDKSANDWINLSRDEISQGHDEEGIADAKNALALNPNNAVAWNNISVANGGLGRWDEAIDAAQKAISLDPNLQLAKNNLAWEQEQQSKADRSPSQVQRR